MSKWSAATGRIRRHATGILGGRIGGVGAAPDPLSGPAPSEHAPSLPAASEHAPSLPAASEHAPSLPAASEHAPSLPAPSEPAARTGASPGPRPRPRAGVSLSDDTVRMPRQPAATAGSEGGASTAGSGGAAMASALTERTINLRLPPAPRRGARGPRHRVGRFLQDIDRQLLPPVGRALALFGRGALWGRVVATTGVLACMALTVVAVYAATRPTTATPKRPGIHVGVSTGDDIHDYIATRRSRLDSAIAADALRDDPTPRYALVSFASYLPPSQLDTLLEGVDAAEVFLRARPAGVVEASVRLIPEDVVKAMAVHTRDLDVAAADLQTQIQGLTNRTPNEIALAATYRDRLGADLREMTDYAEQCDCAFGAVVHGSLATLNTLSQRTGIRVVDLVPLTPDVSRDTFMPLLPDQNGTANPPPVENAQSR